MKMGKTWQNYPVILLGLYAAIWLALAINPAQRLHWFLENALVLVIVPIVIWTYYSFRLSNVTYTLIFLFLVLHTIGAHYTYSATPIGFWLQELLGWQRNHYDRVVHFSYGLLLSYPIREFFLRVAATKGFWGYWFPIELTLAFSALYEIVEMVVARIADPSAGAAFLGTQGDEWDAQKDMGLAAIGSVIAITITALYNWRYDRSFLRELRESLSVKRKHPLGEVEIKKMRDAR